MAIKPTIKPENSGPVQQFIGTAYDVVKKVHDELDKVIAAVPSANIAEQAAQTAVDALTQVAEMYEDFDKRFLGTFTEYPTEDNKGNPLEIGALFYLVGHVTDLDGFYIYGSSGWVPVANTISSDAAAASAEAAATSESTAQTSAIQASDSATAAANSEQAAQTSETKAAQSASAALTSEQNASASEVLALQHRDKSEAWAVTPEDTEVEPGQYSSLHYKEKAVIAKLASEAAASAAATSETNAAKSASNAATSESNAGRSATNAANSEAAALAAKSATETLFDQFGDQYLGALPSAPTTDNSGGPLAEGNVYWDSTDNVLKFYTGTNWTAPEDIATTAANNALASEKNAAISESNAANSASAASTSESNAANSAISASNSATAAATSKNASDLHRQAAADSAAAALNSRNEAEAFASSTSTTATANSIAQRDSAGRLEAAAGVSGNDVVNMGQLPDAPSDLYARANILGTVSQSGGVPTGAIIERGSNANGEYVKYADGTLQVWGEVTLTQDYSASSPVGGGFRTGLINIILPVSFVNTGYKITGGRISGDSAFEFTLFPKTASVAGMVGLTVSSGTILSGVKACFLAVGRWY